MKSHPKSILLFLMIIASSLSGKGSPDAVPAPVRKMLKELRPAPIAADIRFLSSDLLEGRGPGTRGGDLAVEYIVSRFQQMGLKPAGDGGSYLQNFTLVGVSPDPQRASMSFARGTESLPLEYLNDFVATNESQTESDDLEAGLVFVGHGVVAPEYDWDDYKGADLKGKVLVMLVDDPPASPSEPELFGGKARTYYGRWTYKYEEALRQGAIGAILIHTRESAGYGWNVVRNSWGREQPFVKLKAGQPALKVSAWISEEAAGKLARLAGRDLSQMAASASTRDFKPVDLGVSVRCSLSSHLREIRTANVVAEIPGSDPVLRDQAVIYSAHWDHLGIGTPKNGDAIYNGAIDNASGVATILEIARVFSMNPAPKRSVLFAALSTEEGGLRGSEYYASHPIFLPGKTAIDLNYDSIYQLGRVKNVSMLGIERTTFEPVARRVTSALGLRIDPDEHPEQGAFYRSDHFSLAKVGIPAVSIKEGSEYVGKSKEWGQKQFEDYEANRYHQPSDEYDPNWDFTGGVQMSELGLWLGWEAANLPGLPTWNKGDEFLAAREKSMAAR